MPATSCMQFLLKGDLDHPYFVQGEGLKVNLLCSFLRQFLYIQDVLSIDVVGKNVNYVIEQLRSEVKLNTSECLSIG